MYTVDIGSLPSKSYSITVDLTCDHASRYFNDLILMHYVNKYNLVQGFLGYLR